MIPTPSTTHVNFNKVYEPAEDSFLFLDTLSSSSEICFLKEHFPHGSTSPLVVEVGTGSGVVLTFALINALRLVGRTDVLGLGLDINNEACNSTAQTFSVAKKEQEKGSGEMVGCVQSDLVTSLRPGIVDVLLFNPPYVPSTEIPSELHEDLLKNEFESDFQKESNMLALSYAGGVDGMETTNRLLASLSSILSPRGVAYILLCAQNKPDDVSKQIRTWGMEWRVEVAGDSGRKAGWEVLKVLKIWRETG